MSRRAAKADSNQPKIVQAFEKLGCSVQHLHMVGGGCPDIVVGVNGVTVLVEIKTDTGYLTKDQKYFFETWRGYAVIVHSVEEAIDLVNQIRSKP